MSAAAGRRCGLCAHFEPPAPPMENVGRCLWAMRAPRPPWSNRRPWAWMGLDAGGDCPTWAARPRRIHLSRVKGFRLHQVSHGLNGLDARRVDRASPFGNPFRHVSNEGTVAFTSDEEGDHTAELVRLFRDWLERDPDGQTLAIRTRNELRGCNLACWCSLKKPCHADVLLEIANA